MGLIKTGLALAGGYGLIKAASKAANEHEDKKQQRQNQNQNMHYGQPQMPYEGQNQSQMGYMYQNHQYNHPPHPQWGPNPAHQSYPGQHMSNPSHQTQSRSVQGSSELYQGHMNQAPPSYGESRPAEVREHHKPGSAQDYYSQ